MDATFLPTCIDMSELWSFNWSHATNITHKDPRRHGFSAHYGDSSESCFSRKEDWAPSKLGSCSSSIFDSVIFQISFSNSTIVGKKTLFKPSFSTWTTETTPFFFGLCRVGDEQKSYQRCSWRTHSGGSPSLKKCTKKLSGSKDYQQKPPNGCHDFWFDIKKVYGNSERFSCQKHKHSLKTLKKHIIFAHFAHLLTSLPGRTPPRKLRRSASAPEAETAAPKAKRQLVATRQGNTVGLVTADPLLTWALPGEKAR